MIYLAADHRGVSHKAALKHYLEDNGYKVTDLGATGFHKDDDYVDFAREALEKIVKNTSEHKGILLCGSGHGMAIVANKYRSIRAVIGFNVDVAKQSREHEDANVLVIAADWVSVEDMNKIVSIWLESNFSGEERHIRRFKKIKDIEEKNFK